MKFVGLGLVFGYLEMITYGNVIWILGILSFGLAFARSCLGKQSDERQSSNSVLH